MGLLKLTESERLEILNLHNNARIIKEQATSVVSSTAPASTAAPTDDKSKIMAIQTALKTKYNANLGTSGPNKDGVDGILGQNTLTALFTAMKSKSAAPAAGTPAAGTGTQLPTVTVTGQKAPDPAIAAAPNVPLPSVATPAAPGVSGQPAAVAPTQAAPTQAAPQSNRDQRRERQDLRRGNRRAMQDLRAGQRGQQQ